MTRINVGIPPKNLTRQHLLAEHREIKRIPNIVREKMPNLSDLPLQFCLGTGHVKFFYNKLGYLQLRYHSIYDECLKRGYSVEYYGGAWKDIPDKYMGFWNPTERDIELIKQRIIERNGTY